MDNYKNKTKAELIAEIKRLEKLNNGLKVKSGGGLFEVVAGDTTELKNSKDELKKQKDMFELVINSVPTRIFWKDLNSVYLGCNSTFARAAGEKKIKNIIGKNDIDLLWGKEAKRYIDDDRNILKTGIAKIGYEEDYTLANGEKVWWLTSKMPLKDSAGKIIGIICTSEDITEKKLAEQKIKDSEEKYKALYENAPLSYQSLNEDGTFNDVNPRWLETLGYERNEVIGQKYTDFIHPDWKEHFEKNFPAFKKRGYVSDVQFKIRHKKGHYIDISFEGCIGYHPDGSFRQTYCVFQDITAHKQAEILLRNEKKRLRTILDMVGNPIFVKDNNHCITLANHAFYTMFKMDEKDVIGNTLVEAVPEKERHHFLKVDREVLDTGKPDQREEELTVEGFTNTIITRKIRFIDELGCKFIVCSIQDITERKEAELALKESEYKYRQLIENLPQRIFSKDRNHRFLTCNEKFAKDLSLTQENFIGKSDFDLFPSELAEKYQKDDKRIMETGRTEELDEEYIQQGQKKIVHTVKTPMYEENGEIAGVMGIFWDVTEIKKAEEELSNSLEREQNLANIVRNAPIAIAFGYPDGKLENCNEAFIKLTGYTLAELRKINWNKELTPSHWNEVEADALQKLNSKSNFIQYEKEYRHKNGTIIPIELFVYGKFDKFNNLLHYVGFVIDITERKDAEEELKKHRDGLEELIKERTKNLEDKNKELEKFNELFVDREFRIKELKEEIEKLRK